MSAVGLTQDAGWQVGVSRTVPHDLEHVRATLLFPDGLGVWVGPGSTLGDAKGDAYVTTDGTAGELRSLRPGGPRRLTWQPAGRATPTTLQVTIRAGARGTSVRFHRAHLADADERAAVKGRWAAALDRLERVLEG